jgi:hypothetical protein
MELASSGGLKFRTIRHQRFIRQIGVVQSARRSLSPSAEIFIKMLSAVCKSPAGNRKFPAHGCTVGFP